MVYQVKFGRTTRYFRTREQAKSWLKGVRKRKEAKILKSVKNPIARFGLKWARRLS